MQFSVEIHGSQTRLFSKKQRKAKFVFAPLRGRSIAYFGVASHLLVRTMATAAKRAKTASVTGKEGEDVDNSRALVLVPSPAPAAQSGIESRQRLIEASQKRFKTEP